jgi:hypothetical protein
MSKFNLALTGENKVIDCLEQKDWKKKKKKKRKKEKKSQNNCCQAVKHYPFACTK